MAVICESLSTVKRLASLSPNFTPVAPLSPLPVIFTLVPPAAGPDAGESTPAERRAGKEGGGASSVYRSAALVALVPPTVITVTSAVPAAPAGDVAVICPSLSTGQ